MPAWPRALRTNCCPSRVPELKLHEQTISHIKTSFLFNISRAKSVLYTRNTAWRDRTSHGLKHLALSKHYLTPSHVRHVRALPALGSWAGVGGEERKKTLPRARIAQSVQRFARGWTVRGSNPGGGEIFRNRPHRPWAHPASYTMRTGSLSRR
jgi:hypothetical protein